MKYIHTMHMIYIHTYIFFYKKCNHDIYIYIYTHTYTHTHLYTYIGLQFTFFFNNTPKTSFAQVIAYRSVFFLILHLFFNLFIFLLKDNCFTEFYCILSNLNMNQPQVYIYPLPFEPPSHFPPHLTPLG